MCCFNDAKWKKRTLKLKSVIKCFKGVWLSPWERMRTFHCPSVCSFWYFFCLLFLCDLSSFCLFFVILLLFACSFRSFFCLLVLCDLTSVCLFFLIYLLFACSFWYIFCLLVLSDKSSVWLFFPTFLLFVLSGLLVTLVGMFVVCFHASQLGVLGGLSLLVLLHLQLQLIGGDQSVVVPVLVLEHVGDDLLWVHAGLHATFALCHLQLDELSELK